MRCPFCGKEMKKGAIIGDGRSKVYWEAEDEKLGMLDKMVGKGSIDAKYTPTKFKIDADYCGICRKMIFTTDVANSIVN